MLWSRKKRRMTDTSVPTDPDFDADEAAAVVALPADEPEPNIGPDPAEAKSNIAASEDHQ
jgi:hypothetical protein